MTKKVFIVIVIIFLTALLAFIVTSFSSKDESMMGSKAEEVLGTEVFDENTESSKVSENEKNSKLTKLIDGKNSAVKGAVLNKSTAQVLYYQNRNFLLIDFKGNSKSSVGGYPFVNVKEIKWNSDKTKALVREKNRYLIYDLNTSAITDLSEKIDTAIWFKDESKDKIVYKFYDSEIGKRKIAIADFNGENEEILIDGLPYQKVELKIPLNGSKVCYHRQSDANFAGGLDCIDTKTKEIKTLHKGSFAVNYKWANNGNRMLVSYANEQIGNRLILGSMNGKGGEFKSLNFPTSVEKCVWAKDNRKIYCAMMLFEEENLILPNDWISGKYSSTDTLWEIDVETGKKNRLLESSEMVSIDAEDLFLDENEDYLFFTDRKTKSVFSVSLR